MWSKVVKDTSAKAVPRYDGDYNSQEHEDGIPLRQRQPEGNYRRKQMPLCSFYRRGLCRNGSHCRFRHAHELPVHEKINVAPSPIETEAAQTCLLNASIAKPHFVMLVLVGLPGSGKSTFSKRLMERTGNLRSSSSTTTTNCELDKISKSNSLWAIAEQDFLGDRKSVYSFVQRHLYNIPNEIPDIDAADNSNSNINSIFKEDNNNDNNNDNDNNKADNKDEINGNNEEDSNHDVEQMRGIIIDRCNFDVSQRAHWTGLANEIASDGYNILPIGVVMPKPGDFEHSIQQATERGCDRVHSGKEDWRKIVMGMTKTFTTPSLSEGFAGIYWLDTFEDMDPLIDLLINI